MKEWVNESCSESQGKIYNKLVRDKIPDIIIKNGKGCVVQKAKDEDKKMLLRSKLKEEVEEFQKQRI